MVQKGRPLGAYLHIPFCARKCRYCDFLSFPLEGTFLCRHIIEAYTEALCQEIRCFFERKREYLVTSVYLGGGTPSIMDPRLTGMLLDTLFQSAQVDEKAEITIEANPGTLSREKLSAYRAAGINRLSLGLQSTVKKELECLGRIHGYDDFLRSYDLAIREGFDNINIDLMWAIPHQTSASWKHTLRKVVGLDPAHISAYSLIMEEGTPFYENQEIRRLLPDEDEEWEMGELTEQILAEGGYRRYEISNYAKEGRECRHNLCYWDRGDYIGFGLGAASCLCETRFKNGTELEEYLRAPWKDFERREELQALSKREQMEEAMILGLRKIKGVSRREFLSRYGQPLEEVFPHVLEKYMGEGLLVEEGDHIRLTKRGLDVSNRILCDFLS